MRRRSSRLKARMRSSVSYLEAGSEVPVVTTRPAWNPELTRRSSRKLRPRRPPPARRTSASATSETMNALARRFRLSRTRSPSRRPKRRLRRTSSFVRRGDQPDEDRGETHHEEGEDQDSDV